MKIYIDADACPKIIKEITFRAAIRVKANLILVANQYMSTPNSEYITSVVVGNGLNIADDKIVELSEEGDLVITADIPLADRVVEKNAFALNPRGKLYTIDNVKESLSMRNLMTDLRSSGMETSGPPPFNKKDSQEFSNQLDKFLTKYHKK
jgi:uncharacterized protein YaiI (UPF0178 family)